MNTFFFGFTCILNKIVMSISFDVLTSWTLDLLRVTRMLKWRGDLSRCRVPSWPWSYGSWIYKYICNQCLSPLMFWVWISIRAGCTTLCDKVCQWLAIGWWFSPGTPVSSTNITDRPNLTEILLKVMLNTNNQTTPISRCTNILDTTTIIHLTCIGLG